MYSNDSLLAIFTVPDNYLILTQVHNSENNFEIDRTDIRMISLDISGQFIDVLIPIELTGTETVFIAYDLLYHRVICNESFFNKYMYTIYTEILTSLHLCALF